jgi:hypothetical protein
MASNKELEAGLKAMVEDYHLPGGGRKKLSHLVAGHLAWFDAAERRGMGWRDLIGVLTTAGVTRRSGKPLSVGTLSSAVWRKRSEAAEKAGRSRPERLNPPESLNSREKSPREPKHASPEQFRGEKRTVTLQGTDHNKADRRASLPPKRPNSGGRAQTNKEVLAFMDRARALRGRAD